LWDNQLLQLASSSLSSFLRYSKAGRRLPGPTARQEAAQTDRPAGGCPDRQPGRRLPRPTGRQEAVQTDRPAGGCQDRQAGRRLSRPTGRQEAAQTDRPAGGCPDRQAGRRLPRPTGRQEAAQTDTCHAARCRTAARVAKAYQMVASRSNSHCTRFEGVRVE